MKKLILTIFVVGTIMSPFLFSYDAAASDISVTSERAANWYEGHIFDLTIVNGNYYMDYYSITIFSIKDNFLGIRLHGGTII